MTFFNTISDKRTTVSDSSFNGVSKISAQIGESENVLDSEWKLTVPTVKFQISCVVWSSLVIALKLPKARFPLVYPVENLVENPGFRVDRLNEKQA